MVSAVSKAKIPVAAGKINKFSLPSVHITTGGFMRFFPAFYRLSTKATTFKDKHDTFIRTNPLDKPFYGNVTVNNRAFFVPFRTVWPVWHDFFNDVPHIQDQGSQLITQSPMISTAYLIDAFCVNGLNDWVVPHSSGYSVDIYDSNAAGYVFTSKGRAVASFLAALGYPIFNMTTTHHYSALKLLAAAKIYLDWYFPSAYAHYGNYASIQGILQRHFTYTLTAAELYLILNTILLVSYKSDFYTSLWDSPVGPNPNTGSTNFQIPDVTNNASSSHAIATNDVNVSNPTSPLVKPSNGTPFIGTSYTSGSSTVNGVVTSYAIKSLERLTSYVKRHQLAGSRSLDRALAQFGVLLDAEKLNRCYYLGSDEFPLHVADVMSTAETSDASLGAYAGKAIASSVKDFDCYTDEEGVFMVINTICPDVFYHQGIDPTSDLIYKLDFYNPEFDGLGPQVVKANQMYVERESILADRIIRNDQFENQIFGYAPRYYYYKIPFNKLTGSFIFGNVNTDLNSWYISRKLTLPANLSTFKHNLDFVIGNDADQYADVFLMPSEKEFVDPFYIIHRDNLVQTAPMRPLYDTLDFEHDEDNRKITTEPNGVKFD